MVAAPPPFRQARPRVLALEGVDKVFPGGIEALHGLTLAVHAGEFVTLLGPSGCGKSTVLRLIAGLAEPSRGRVVWDGGRSENDLGIVFQEPTLMPWATVAQNVWLPFRLRGLRFAQVRGEVSEALAQVGLDGFHDAYPRALSGGMKMRVAIARAMVTRPRIILMDEPFAALDEITRFRLNDDLLALRARIGCTVVFVTHSVYESVFLSDRIAVMAARPGRVVRELVIDAPAPRPPEFRTSADYAARCREASAALRAAMGEPA